MSELEWSIPALAAAVGASMFFSLNDLALRSFSRVKLQEAFRAAGRSEAPEAFLDRVEMLALMCASYRLLADVTVVMLLVHLFAREEVNYVGAFVTSSLVLGVFRLAIPRAWSKYSAEAILVRTYGLLAALWYPVMPLLWCHRQLEAVVRRLAGVTSSGQEQIQEETQGEILDAVEQGRAEGVVDEEQAEMIESVLELGETTAKEIMTPRTDLIALDVNDDLPTVIETIRREGHPRVPVYEGSIDNIIGLVYAKDLLSEIGRDPLQFRLRDKLRKVSFVPETKPLQALLREFQTQKLHIAVVLDEYGGTAGIVTIEDIFEELVGDIADEHEKTPIETIRRVDEATVEVDARIYIDDLNSKLHVSLPEDDDYDTLGGFIFSHLGSIPPAGHTFEHHGLRFTIVSAEPRKINRIRLTRLAAGKGG